MRRVSLAVWQFAISYGAFAGKSEAGWTIRHRGRLYCWRTDAGLEGPWEVL